MGQMEGVGVSYLPDEAHNKQEIGKRIRWLSAESVRMYNIDKGGGGRAW